MEVLYVLTWLCIALSVYVYIGYVFVLMIIGLFIKRPVQQAPIEPHVSLIIAAFNEEVVIAEKLDNSLKLDYPSDKLEIIVAADGSNDRTAEIAQAFADKDVVTLYEPERRGKSHALNRAIEQAKGEIIVFSDANAYYKPDAIRHLVRNFADPSVGIVSGSKTVLDAKTQTIASEGAYWKYESFLKKLESRIHSTVGVVGEMLAIRRDQYVPIPSNFINDDAYLAFHAMRTGKRVIYESKAISYETPSVSAQDEVVRRERMNAGRYQLFFKPMTMWPLASPLPLFMLISHKFMRLLLPFFMLGALVFNLLIVLMPDVPVIFWVTLGLQLAFYGVALLGGLGVRNGITKIASYIVVSNIASVKGLLRYLRGQQSVLWEKARRA